MVFWGLGVRMVYVLHVTWMINSVTHMWVRTHVDPRSGNVACGVDIVGPSSLVTLLQNVPELVPAQRGSRRQ